MSRRRAIGRAFPAGLAGLLLLAALGVPPAGAEPSATVEAGLDALGTGHYGQAQDTFRAILAEAPRDVEAMRHLGVAYLAEGRLREAFSTFQTLRVLDPDDPRVHLYLAQVYYQAGLSERERAALRQALALNPAFREAHLLLAHALAAAGEYYAAAFEYTWLIGRAEADGRPPEPSVLFNLAAIQERMDRPRAAAELFTRYLALAPTGEQAERARARLTHLATLPSEAPPPPGPQDAAGPP